MFSRQMIGGLILSISFLLGGCSLGGKAVVPNTESVLADFSPSLTIEPIWQIQLNANKSQVKRLKLAHNANHYFAASGAQIFAVNKHNGASVWQQSIGNDISAGIATYNDLLLLGTVDGYVVAVDASQGKIRWLADMGSEVIGLATDNDKAIAAKTANGHLHILAPDTGNILWSRKENTPIVNQYGGSNPYIVATGHVVTGFDNGKVIVYGLGTRLPLWEAQLSGPSNMAGIERLVDIDAELLVLQEDGALFASSLYGTTAGINLPTGDIVWRAPLRSDTGFVGGMQALYLTTSESELVRLRGETGEQVWKTSGFAKRHLTAPVLSTDSIIVADNRGTLHWLSPEDGSFKARVQGDSKGYISPLLFDSDRVIALGKSGLLSVFPAH